MVRTISLIIHSKNAISVPTTEKNLPVEDILNGEAKKKSVRYATSQIVNQPSIQHLKLKSPKRNLVTNTQSIRKKITANANSTSICSILKKKTQMMVLLNTLKNSI